MARNTWWVLETVLQALQAPWPTAPGPAPQWTAPTMYSSVVHDSSDAMLSLPNFIDEENKAGRS